MLNSITHNLPFLYGYHYFGVGVITLATYVFMNLMDINTSVYLSLCKIIIIKCLLRNDKIESILYFVTEFFKFVIIKLLNGIQLN